MENKRPSVFVVFFALCCLVLTSGCETSGVFDNLGAIQVGNFRLSESQVGAIKKSAQAMGKAFTDITPEQEYYVGRAVGATLLGRYQPRTEANSVQYLNLVGDSLAAVSDMPETYGGYHFVLLEDEGINAFAAPGGLIFISRGMLRCCQDEDTLAAVLAHEIAHVQLKHGLQAIKTSRLTTAFSIMATEGAKQAGGPELSQLTALFEDSIHDVTATLVNSGYSRAFEREADAVALVILGRAGYDQHSLVTLLREMKLRLNPQGLDFAKTHPDPAERIAELEPQLGEATVPPGKPQRQQRFKSIFGSI
ncbi:M48 family metallopeptidase [Thiovibrio frasassiensis]|uniref:M48 family metallopeptidase n=1 Tax=Thiovibrio frasassiensis TaxID=2984131 RepID=A0A9X4RKX9_9BACT|nr:M48 family metallopeptidase [Thiovibrio frasassiensis]MDG4475074.1 M48 family metallopeptidase [Thiovibrio frasassiensis]